MKQSLLFSLVLFLFGCSIPRPGTGVTDTGVRFVLEAPAARTVAVVGDFNQWDPGRNQLAGPDEKGCWSLTLPLDAGRYEYLFLINNSTWVADPASPVVDDGLGNRNSVIIVQPRTE